MECFQKWNSKLILDNYCELQLEIVTFESISKHIFKNFHNHRLRIRLVIFRNGNILYEFLIIKNKNIHQFKSSI